jgi:hypothetical protein
MAIYFKKSLLWTLSAFIFTACHQSMMSRSSFEQIPIGAPIASVHQQTGAPYEIERHSDGSQTHRYIERIEIGPNAVDQTTYTLRVSNGAVVDKQCTVNSSTVDIRSP